MRRSLSLLDPRRWSRGVRALAVALLASLFALHRGVTRLMPAWQARRVERAYASLSLPRVSTSLPGLYPSVRVRISPEAVDLDARPLMEALDPELRRSVVASTEALWRDALFGESLAMLRLEHGRLRDDGDRRAKLRRLDDRRQRLHDALRGVNMEQLDHRNRYTPIYFIDPRVPMRTVAEVIAHTATGSFGLALHGPRGLVTLEYAARICAPVPSIELDVHAASVVLRTSTGRRGCTGGPHDAEVTTVTLARTGVDRGIGALRRALIAAPWSLTARNAANGASRRDAADARTTDSTAATLAALTATLAGGEPWGEIAIQVDGDIPYEDCVDVVMAARERSPGSCDADGLIARDGCLFPEFELRVRTDDGRGRQR